MQLTEDLIPRVTRLVNSVYLYDSINDWSIVRSSFLDPNFDPALTYVGIEDGVPRGVVVGAARTKEPKELVSAEHSWLKMIAVTPDFLERGLGDELLDKAEASLRDMGFKDIRATDFAGWQIFPGINVKSEVMLQFLLRKGYKKASETANYTVDLGGFRIPRMARDIEQALREDGLSFRIPNTEEKEKIAAWVIENFGPIYSYEVTMAFRHIVPGMILAEKENDSVGFCTMSALELDWLGPLGVIDQERKNEIGTVLLHRALWEMKLRGQRTASITSESSLSSFSLFPNVANVNKYWILHKKIS